jgi:endonuclease III related protein
MHQSLATTLHTLYADMLAHYGPQDAWWPTFTPQPRFEIALGSLLVQQTRWERVEQALHNLLGFFGAAFGPDALAHTAPDQLRELIRPVAYYNAKARWLPGFCAFFAAHPAGLDGALAAPDLPALRRALLALPGVGPETADTVLLYAGGRPSFVVDAYLRRLFARLGCLPLDAQRASYAQLQALFHAALPIEYYVDFPHLQGDPARLYAEYHALIVEHGVRHCTSARPRCDVSGATRIYTAEAGRTWRCPPCGGCPLREQCGFYHNRLQIAD